MAQSTQHVHSTWNATLRTILGGAAIVTLVLLAFVWPTATSKVHNLPLAVVGQGSQADTVTQKLQESGAFTVSSRADRAAAVDGIEKREIYGAVVLPSQPGGATEVLTSSAASPVVSQMLTGLAAQFGQAGAQQAGAAKQQAAQGAAQAGAQAAAAQASYQTLLGVQQQLPEPQRPALQPKLDEAKQKADAAAADATKAKAAVDAIPTPTMSVTDVVPLSKDDPRGTGIALAALPIAFGGMIGGSLISMLLVGPLRRFVALLGYSVLGSLGMTAVMVGWFHLVPGAWWGTWGILALALAATGATIVGLNALIGRAGIPLGAVLTMLLGNPLSSAQAPTEFLPWHWGAIGQYFVPGAATSLLRTHAYFPRASLTHPLLVLCAWAAAGLVLMFAGHFRSQEIVHVDGYTEPDHERHARRATEGSSGATVPAAAASEDAETEATDAEATDAEAKPRRSAGLAPAGATAARP